MHRDTILDINVRGRNKFSVCDDMMKSH